MSDDLQAMIERYNALVGQYHELDEQIDRLIDTHGGGTETMQTGEIAEYRRLAQLRDDIFSEMRALESVLFGEDEN